MLYIDNCNLNWFIISLYWPGAGTLEVTLLGQFYVRHRGRRIRFLTRNAQALLAYLQLNAGKDQRRERFAGP